MNMFHDWLLGYAQKFVDLAARYGFTLFFIVELLLGLHVVVFLLLPINLLGSFVLVTLTIILIIGWFGSKHLIKSGCINPRRYMIVFSLPLTLFFVATPLPPFDLTNLYSLTGTMFLLFSQCNYIEPQVPEHQQEQSFAA